MFMAQNIFEPLGLDETSFFLPPDKLNQLPAFYRSVDGKLQLERDHGEDFPRSTYFHGGGGVASSPKDLLRFAQIFLDAGRVDDVRLLRAETVQNMLSDHIGSKSPYRDRRGWGFGASVITNTDGTTREYGWVGGGYAILWVNPESRTVAYFAFPLTPPGDAALIDEFRDAVYAAMTQSEGCQVASGG